MDNFARYSQSFDTNLFFEYESKNHTRNFNDPNDTQIDSIEIFVEYELIDVICNDKFQEERSE